MVSMVSITVHVFIVFPLLIYSIGVCGSVVVEPLCYKPEGQGFETR
jgi:hypothetical protein